MGVVPFAGLGYQFLDEAKALPPQTPEARRGLAVGQIVGGFISLWGGLTGEVLGGIATVTGLGAAIGVPAIVVSTGLVLGGMGNIAAGIHGLMTTGSGSGGPKATAPTAGGAKATSKIDRSTFKAEREAFWKAEAKNNPGKYTPEDLARMEKGRAPMGPDGHPTELHHVDRTPEGGLRPMSRTEHRIGENYKKNHR